MQRAVSFAGAFKQTRQTTQMRMGRVLDLQQGD